MTLVSGIHPVEILLATSPEKIRVLFYIPRKSPSPKIQRLLEKAHQHHIPITPATPEEAPKNGIPHQGIWARIQPLSPLSLKAWLLEQHSHDFSTLLILDGITDPRNLGAIIRTAACLGCQGILLPKDRSASLTPVVWKASAGAAGVLPVVREVNLARCVERLKKEGFWIFGTRAHKSIPAWEAPWTHRCAIILGSEEKGIRPHLASKCDFHLSIPLTGPVTSLNVSVAAGMILYERTRWIALKREKGENPNA